jgi:hypothetical protein
MIRLVGAQLEQLNRDGLNRPATSSLLRVEIVGCSGGCAGWLPVRSFLASLQSIFHPFTHVQACNTDDAIGAIRAGGLRTKDDRASRQTRSLRLFSAALLK